MYVIMEKIYENNDFVCYKFKKEIWIPTGNVDKRGYKIENLKEIYGYCGFNKKTADFILNKEDTDEYFLNPRNREISWVHLKLIEFMEENKSYPEVHMIARG